MLKDYMHKGAWRNLRRLRGMSTVRKFRYMLRVAAGELTPARAFGLHGLRLVEISLTDRCQCRCAHCFAATDGHKDELAAADVDRLLHELAGLGIMEVCFSGGEPLLHPDLVSLVASACRRGCVVRLISNGVLLTEDMVVRLKQAGLGWCSVSLDGPTPAAHNTFRGYPDCFERAVDGLRFLVRHDVPCSIITVARRAVIRSGELEDIVRLGSDLGVTAVRINFPVPLGRFEDRDDQVLTLPERDKVRRLLRYGIATMELPRERTPCKGGITKVNVLPTGDVTPCVFIPLAFGNIHHDGFVDIWKAMREYSRQFKVRGRCPVCDPVARARIREAAAMRQGREEEYRENPQIPRNIPSGSTHCVH